LVGSVGEACTCYAYNFSSSRALFSTAGNVPVMTKKRSRLTCDSKEDLVYLHEVLPQVREWETVKKMRLEYFFLESMKQITFNVFSVPVSEGLVKRHS